MSNKSRGLYDKYRVRRTDGRDADGGDRTDCQYFVLDLTHGKFAAPALEAYAASCASEYPKLSSEIREAVELHKSTQPTNNEKAK